MTLTVSKLLGLCAFADKSEDTFAGLPGDCALACSLTMMPKLNERTNDKQVSHVTARERLIRERLFFARPMASETMMPYNETATWALLINRARGVEFVISILYSVKLRITSLVRSSALSRQGRRLAVKRLACRK